MKSNKMRFFSQAIAYLLVVLSVTFLSNTALAGQEKTAWPWTEQNPKPSWWIWGDDYEEAKPVRGGYFREASSVYVGLMNPNHWPINDFITLGHMYEALLNNDGKARPIVPWLAASWEFTSPTSIVMHLRKGIRFHDGAVFDAQALKYQMEWVKNRKNGAWTRSWLTNVKSVQVLDRYTVRWTLTKPWMPFFGIMTTPVGLMVSPKALKADQAAVKSQKLEKKLATARKKLKKLEKKAETGAKKALKKLKKQQGNVAKLEKSLTKAQAASAGVIPLDKHAVGTGRFMVEEARPGNYLKLKRNPDWWFGQSIGQPEMPWFDGRIITIIPDASVQLANLRAGRLDRVNISPVQYQMVKRDPNLDVEHFPPNDVNFLLINGTKGPCRDIRVRKAISHAIDRKAIIMGAHYGLATEASCLYPPTHWAHNPALSPVRYDPELSKTLLKEAGYGGGLTIGGVVSNAGNTNKTVAMAIKGMLNEVGVNWNYDVLDSVAASDRFRNAEYDLSWGGWTYITEPDMSATGLYTPEGPFNLGRTDNQAAAQLIEAAREEMDPAERQKLYHRMEEEVYNNYDDVWLYFREALFAQRKKVKGWSTRMYMEGGRAFVFSHPLWFKDGRQ
ncbi:MAG: ABC transporter substrate-binding protein [Proteobacteria bacterium]|nr:ABC transporter substrate-binding protein [Pseudomonadota bacterium]